MNTAVSAQVILRRDGRFRWMWRFIASPKDRGWSTVGWALTRRGANARASQYVELVTQATGQPVMLS